MREGKVLFKGIKAGRIWEEDDGYNFQYEPDYLVMPGAEPISLTLPLRSQVYFERTMIPFFDGLIPEGWLLDITAQNWKLDTRDRMGLLLAACRDCIGAVSVEDENGKK